MSRPASKYSFLRKEFFTSVAVSLKYPNYRLYFGGMCISLIGTWIQQTAISWLVYKLTGSVFLLATITFTAQIPILLATPFTSILADRTDRRTILLITQSLSALQALLLAVLTLSGLIAVWHLLFLSLFIGLVNALDSPTRQAFYPGLVPKENLGNAIALNSAAINGSRLIGPAIGGLLIGMFGEGICFLINGFSFLGVLIALQKMQLSGSPEKLIHRKLLCDLSEGFSYVWGNLTIRTLLLLMSCVSFFGLPLVTFLPAYVKDLLRGESEMLGLLLSCIGIGSLIAACWLAICKKTSGLGKTAALSTLLLGICFLNLSFIRIPCIAALICVAAGFFIILTVASIHTLLQHVSAEDKRGRVMGYLTMTFTGISPLGGLVLGILENQLGLPGLILLSGSCCIFIGAVFEHYRHRIQEHIVAALSPARKNRNR